MKRKPPAKSRRILLTNPGRSTPSRHERPDDDLYFLAQAVHRAAKKLAGTLQLGMNPLGEFDPYPVLFLYRHAAELFLKAMVLGDGGNFRATKPDHLSVGKTRSVSWLAQFVSQIVTVMHWEEQFRCEGAEDLAAFKAVIGEVNEIDVGHGLFRASCDPVTTLPEFLRRLNSLLDLLDSTADALAAEWDLRNEATVLDADWNDGGGFEPTIP